jgi:hypothetical protein
MWSRAWDPNRTKKADRIRGTPTRLPPTLSGNLDPHGKIISRRPSGCSGQAPPAAWPDVPPRVASLWTGRPLPLTVIARSPKGDVAIFRRASLLRWKDCHPEDELRASGPFRARNDVALAKIATLKTSSGQAPMTGLAMTSLLWSKSTPSVWGRVLGGGAGRISKVGDDVPRRGLPRWSDRELSGGRPSDGLVCKHCCPLKGGAASSCLD